jgi:hypothetical protein
MLCLSECQPGDMGPRRVTQSKIRTRFDHGWRVDSIDPATIDIKSAPSFWSGCRARPGSEGTLFAQHGVHHCCQAIATRR